ncbi:hypothetical protein AB0F81_07915 [Actinoplanes sp. NPDC024001]|uniref:hypothetical protein n=1 Tax=Actinoplanes sp. NPDC024001 TaxID=3154598 RepID=UPI0033DE8C5B
MTTWRKFSRTLARLTDRLALPSGFPADGRSLGLGLAAALENQRRTARPSDEEIARFLRGSAPDEGLIKA